MTTQIHFLSENSLAEILNNIKVASALSHDETTDALWKNFQERIVEDFEIQTLSHDFVGYICDHQSNHIVLPKVFDDVENLTIERNQYLSTLLNKVFQTYQKIPEQKAIKTISINSASDRGHSTQNLLVIGQKILQDWYENDFIIRMRILNHSKNPDQISWIDTVQTSMPIISNGIPIFLDCVGEQHLYDHTHPISDVHRWVVQDIHKHFGFVLELPRIDLSHKNYPPKHMIAIVQETLNEVTSQREDHLLELLLKYLEMKYNSTNMHRIELLGTISFHVVFEKMLHQTLQASKNSPLIKKINSSPTWHMLTPYSITKPKKADFTSLSSSNQQIDILIEHPEYTILADAKYYAVDSQLDLLSFLTIKHFPATKDVRKQIFYAQILEQHCSSSTIFNYFIFPLANAAYDSDDFYYMGNITWEKFSNNSSPLIEVFGIHLERLMKKYISHQHLKLPII